MLVGASTGQFEQKLLAQRAHLQKYEQIKPWPRCRLVKATSLGITASSSKPASSPERQGQRPHWLPGSSSEKHKQLDKQASVFAVLRLHCLPEGKEGLDKRGGWQELLEPVVCRGTQGRAG